MPGTFTAEQDQLVQEPVVTAINNYIQIVHAAVRYDLADIRPNNMFTDSTLTSRYLDTADEVEGIFPGAAAIIQGATSLPQQQSVSVKTEFLCQVKRVKSVPSFIFAVAGLALSNFVRSRDIEVLLRASLSLISTRLPYGEPSS